MRYWIDGRVMVACEHAPNSEYAETGIDDMAQQLVRWCSESVENAYYLCTNPPYAYIKGVQDVYPVATDMQTRNDIISLARALIQSSPDFISVHMPQKVKSK